MSELIWDHFNLFVLNDYIIYESSIKCIFKHLFVLKLAISDKCSQLVCGTGLGVNESGRCEDGGL